MCACMTEHTARPCEGWRAGQTARACCFDSTSDPRRARGTGLVLICFLLYLTRILIDRTDPRSCTVRLQATRPLWCSFFWRKGRCRTSATEFDYPCAALCFIFIYSVILQNGRTALHCAARNGCRDAILALLPVLSTELTSPDNVCFHYSRFHAVHYHCCICRTATPPCTLHCSRPRGSGAFLPCSFTVLS